MVFKLEKGENSLEMRCCDQVLFTILLPADGSTSGGMAAVCVNCQSLRLMAGPHVAHGEQFDQVVADALASAAHERAN